MTFFQWYVHDGVRALLGAWRVWAGFVWRVFHIAHHARTLLAPWHRDVSFRKRRGLHPILFLKRLANNLFARVIGAIVRTVVIATGLVLLCCVSIAYSVALVTYIALPMVAVGIAVAVFAATPQSLALAALAALAIACVGGGAFYVYRRTRAHVPYREMSFAQLHAQPWFARVYARLDIARADVTDAMLADFAQFESLLARKSVTPREFAQIVEWEIERQEEEERRALWWRPAMLARVRPIGLHWVYGYTVHLDRYSVDLTRGDDSEYARAVFVGRENARHLLRMTLERPRDNNAMLIGDVGVGKKTLLHHMAREIRTGAFDALPHLRDKRIVLLDLAAALADAQHADGGIDHFLHNIFHEAAYAGNVVLAIENFHHFIRDSKASYDVTPIIAEYLHLPTFQVIALLPRKVYNRDITQRADLLKYFTPIMVDEASEEEALAALRNHFAYSERDRVLFSYQAQRAIVRLSGRYRAEAPLPERAIDLATEALLYWRDHATAAYVREDDVRAFLTQKTGMPMGKISAGERAKLLNMERILHERIIGQDDAVCEIAEAVRILRSGIADPTKPMASFLFLGPTGVGKTETAKALAATYYGDEKKMIRIDMSEFQGPDAVRLLIGDEATGEQGRLTTAAREEPYALLLLDELEKAHPRALDIFLQILDEGYVTDAFGDKANFRNMIIIATSNAGALFLREALARGERITDIKPRLIDKIIADGIYRPEFLNRFGEIILFRPLTKDEAGKVARLMLASLVQRIKRERSIAVHIDDSAVPVIVRNGYDEAFGARALARYIDDTVADIIARKIIADGIAAGGEITVTAADITAAA